MSGRINVHIETYGQTGSPWVCSSNSLVAQYPCWETNSFVWALCYASIFLGFDSRKNIREIDKKNKRKSERKFWLAEKDGWFCVMGLSFVLDLLYQKDWKHQGIFSLQIQLKFSQKFSAGVHIRICSNIKSEFSAGKDWEQPISVSFYNDLYLKKSMG